jgi:hypothetical protein
VQGVLETLALPYTHCGVLASALAMDKAKAKAVLAAAGRDVPGGGLFNRFEVAADHVMPPPYVVKPTPRAPRSACSWCSTARIARRRRSSRPPGPSARR